MQVDLVVFVVPAGATAVTAVAGHGDLAVRARFFAIVALDQFCVPGRAAPVLLDTRARLAQITGFGF